MKKIGVILSILTVLTLSFITNNNVSAASDVTYTLSSTSGNSGSFYFCNNNNSDFANCSDYSYIKFSPTDTSLTNSFYIYTNSSTNQITYKTTFGDLVFSLNNFEFVYFNQSTSFLGNSTITVTLTDNPFPGDGIFPDGTLDIVANGTYDVTNYASVDVQVEESSFIVQLFNQGFWGVATAIVGIIVPILALFLVFRLVHGLIFGKGM